MKLAQAIIHPMGAAGKRGQTLVEYTIVLAFISVLAVGVFAALGDRIALIFSAIDNILDTAQGS